MTRGVSLRLATLNPEALTVVRRSPLGEILGHERLFFNLREAVAAYEGGPVSANAPEGRIPPSADLEGGIE